MSAPFVVRKLSPMRRAIAARMEEVARTIPHFRLTIDIDLDNLLARRERFVFDPEDPQTRRPSINDYVVKGCALALMDVPGLNCNWVENEIHQFRHADISIVTAVPDGLVAPIVRNAEGKSVREISREIRALRARAKANALKMNELVGGSFTVSNLGMYRVDQFDAIINAPQCAILAVGAAGPRPRISGTGECAAITGMRATLSVDHRAVDGPLAADFLNSLRHHLEDPDATGLEG